MRNGFWLGLMFGSLLALALNLWHLRMVDQAIATAEQHIARADSLIREANLKSASLDSLADTLEPSVP